MLLKEFHRTRADGIKLYKIISDNNVYIKNIDTNKIFESVIIPEATSNSYIETDIKIKKASKRPKSLQQGE
jgi:hypothetical protein